jgi:hypothetical protein
MTKIAEQVSPINADAIVYLAKIKVFDCKVIQCDDCLKLFGSGWIREETEIAETALKAGWELVADGEVVCPPCIMRRDAGRGGQL